MKLVPSGEVALQIFSEVRDVSGVAMLLDDLADIACRANRGLRTNAEEAVSYALSDAD